jgi:hypothetical protein
MSKVISFLTGHAGGGRRGSYTTGVSQVEAVASRKLLTVEFVEARDLYDVDKVRIISFGL